MHKEQVTTLIVTILRYYLFTKKQKTILCIESWLLKMLDSRMNRNQGTLSCNYGDSFIQKLKKRREKNKHALTTKLLDISQPTH